MLEVYLDPCTVNSRKVLAGLDLVGAPFAPGLLPFDLTRGGNLFNFHATGNINQYAFYVQDGITAGDFLFNVGFRLDRYDGLVSKTEPEPRVGIAYNIKGTGTVLRIAYARTFETPFNENLLLSNATGVGGLAQNVFGVNAVTIQPGFRNQFNAGFQQAIGKFLLWHPTAATVRPESFKPPRVKPIGLDACVG